MHSTLSVWGAVGFGWGVLGLVVGLVFGIARLVPLALEPFATGMTVPQTLAYAANVIFIAYTEGYRGFQKGFAPRVAARALHIAHNPNPIHVIFAPLFVVGYFHATKRRLISSWLLTVMIVALVVLVRFLDQPWRGCVDGGVVVGLSWGTIAIVVYSWRALSGRPLPVASDVPS